MEAPSPLEQCHMRRRLIEALAQAHTNGRIPDRVFREQRLMADLHDAGELPMPEPGDEDVLAAIQDNMRRIEQVIAELDPKEH
jgi:hypothetical protein